ncbi:hypothetical protein J2X31_002247 [Flavobacterium arsenatis]|uniref:DUF4595 domain-containing protein n=1 Tax=Flavobacterium arsenatis TaxID=1484332 RepID=A0ABU1TQH6_9FLAO|nr:hypothetical protein [Flavobacterium arsenatis]MDR6968230.1 hypothetical protein [Flavobacterium arsenatis]
MKTTLKINATNASESIKKSIPFPFRCLVLATLFMVTLSSCNDDDVQQTPPVSIDCKTRPDRISFGGDITDIAYNTENQLIKITKSDYNIAAPTQPPVISEYTIEYNAQGNASKVSKSIDNQLELYYQLEYDPSGKLAKQSEFNAQGALVAYTTPQYDANSVLTNITTHKEGTSIEVTSSYQYLDGNLVKKSVQNLFDLDSQEYYTADYTYTYFLDKENKVEPYFEGPLGLLFISNLSNQESLQYLPKSPIHQLAFARETPSETKMLKNIEIIAYRYSTQDTTHIDYSYDYDTDGFPTVQRGNYENVTRRYVPTPFGGTVLLVTPTTNALESTVNFSCN